MYKLPAAENALKLTRNYFAANTGLMRFNIISADEFKISESVPVPSAELLLLSLIKLAV